MKKPKIAILGIGNRLRGDDGAGSILAEKLKLAGMDQLLRLEARSMQQSGLTAIFAGHGKVDF